jgi:CheY-like chemotaxis protein
MASKPRILIIDDDVANARMMQLSLEPTYEVHLAYEGRTGLAMVESKHPHLILLDLRMPGPDGFSVLAKLKADTATNTIPIVIVSGRGETDVLMEGQQAGAADHLIKPFTNDELRTAVKRQLIVRGQQSEAAP